MPQHYDKRVFLTLDDKVYKCQMGCPGLFDLKDIEKHMVNTHTKEELWKWSINNEKLIAALDYAEIKKKKNKTPDLKTKLEVG